MTDVGAITLVEFLRARFAEDEQVAREASGATMIGETGNWQPAPGGDEWAAEITEESDEWLVALRPRLPVPPDVMSGKWGAVMHRDAFNPEEPRADRASKPLLHAVRHDPRRVLAECAAKRRIVELHAVEDWDEHGDDPWRYRCAICQPAAESERAERYYDRTGAAWPCDTLKLLALPYADHPDYRPEWRP